MPTRQWNAYGVGKHQVDHLMRGPAGRPMIFLAGGEGSRLCAAIAADTYRSEGAPLNSHVSVAGTGGVRRTGGCAAQGSLSGATPAVTAFGKGCGGLPWERSKGDDH